MAFANALLLTLALGNPSPATTPSTVDDAELDLDLDFEDGIPDAPTVEPPPALDATRQYEAYPGDSYDDDDDDDWRYSYRKSKWDGGMHFSFGLAPMSTLTSEGFHPGVRWDVEMGMAWRRGRTKISVGPDLHILQYYGRKKPGFGVDAMTTLSLQHVYVRMGAGTAMGIPTRLDINDTRPMMGGLVGAGVVGRVNKVEGRLGVDYDVRIDTTGRVAQTVMVAMRLSFGP